LRFEPLEQRQLLATFIVNSNGDQPDINPGDGICDTGGISGGAAACTLRAAIQEANATANAGGLPDVIHFNIIEVGPHSIQLITELPVITEAVIIDGFTEPGANATSNAFPLPLNPSIQIDIDGRNVVARGFDITGGDSVIRGVTLRRFTQQGILIRDGGNNVIEGNYIGTNLFGNFAFPNGAAGIEIRNSSDNRIGGSSPAQRNLISANGSEGILIDGTFGATNNNVVQGNFIGVNAQGTIDMGNNVGVLVVDAVQTQIGGPTASAGNLIAGSTFDGISLVGLTKSDLFTLVQNNLIGTNSAGADLGNRGFGISVSSSNNLLADNTVAFTKLSGASGVGIGIGSGTGNAILRNRIHQNATLGIDLASGSVTPNDPGDADTGPNNLQNFPVLTSVTTNGNPVIRGTLNSQANQSYRIEFFSSPAADPSGFGEGQVYLGFVNVTTNASGDAAIEFISGIAITGGHVVTATATLLGAANAPIETSEFSAAFVTVANQAPTNITLDRTDTFANIAAAWIGEVSVSDPNAGDSHTFAFNDNRFEIRNGQLYLKPGASVPLSPATINLQITAIDSSGLEFSRLFELDVIAPPSEWTCAHQWGLFPVDVNADGIVNALDAITIINDLNIRGISDVPVAVPGTVAAPFLDVSCDGAVSPTDAVLVRNYLNAIGVGAVGEGEPASANWEPGTMATTTVEPIPLATSVAAASHASNSPLLLLDSADISLDSSPSAAIPPLVTALESAIVWEQLSREPLSHLSQPARPVPDFGSATSVTTDRDETDEWDWLWASESDGP
jgi:CSLREA domain-containing protein